MALRNFGNTLLHVSYIAGAIWLGAHELALHNITDSDVYKGPTESPVPVPLNSPVVPSIEPLQQSTSTSTIFDAPTITTTTTEYITVTRDDDPTPVPIFHELSSRNPYANNSFVLGAIPYVVPFFKSSYGQALSHFLSSLSSHPVTKAIYQATASLISFLLYLWSILPGGKQGLNTLILALSVYALQFAYVWDPLARWFSRFFRRRDNKSPPSQDSHPSPPPSPPSSGRSAGDNKDSLLPKDTSSTGTQTTPGNTQSADTQTTGLITEGERNRLNEVAHLQGQLESLRNDLAQANADIGTRDIIIADRNITIDQYENERRFNDQDHRREIDRLQAKNGTAASSSEAESDEIKRLKEAHEAHIRELQATHDSTVQNLESGVQSLQTENGGLRHNNERLQKENKALSQQSESSSGTAKNTNSAEERQRLEGQVRGLQEEVQSLTAAHEQQQKLSLEAQSEQETALTNCKNKVKALESTNTGLTQQNEALLEQERAAKQAEEKAKADVEALQTQVDSLEHSLFLARAGNEAAAGLQQEIADARKREKARVNELQQRLSQAEAARDTAVRQQQDDAATAQRMRESEEQLTRRISNLEQDLLQARSAHAADVETANIDNIRLQHELSELQKENETMRKQGQELLEANEMMRKQGQGLLNERQELQTVRDQYAALNKRYEQEGGALQRDYEALKLASKEQAQKIADEKSALEAQAQKRLQYEKQNCEGLRKSIKDLQAKVNQSEGENSQARAEISALEKEVEMLQRANDNLIAANDKLANQDAMKQWAEMSAADANQNTSNGIFPQHQQKEDTNPTVQPTPFTNPPVFPPPRSDGESQLKPPMLPPSDRKIAPLRKRSIPKKDTTADNTTSTSGLANRPMETPRSTPGQPPVRPIFDLQSSRPTGLNVFETVNGPTHQVITDFTNGALSNAPVLQSNHNFATGAAGHARNPADPETVLDPALGGIPSSAVGVTGDRQHQEMLEEGRRRHKEALENQRKYDLGNYEDDDSTDASRTNATDGPTDSRMDIEPTGNTSADAEMSNHPHGVPNSKQEIAFLRTLPGNDNEAGIFDELYRRHDYQPPDGFDEFDGPLFRDELVPGDSNEIFFLRNMVGNEDGRFDDMYRGNNYNNPDAWDDDDNPVWY